MQKSPISSPVRENEPLVDHLYFFILGIDARSKLAWFFSCSFVFIAKSPILVEWLLFTSVFVFFACRAHRTIYMKAFLYIFILFLIIFGLAYLRSPGSENLYENIFIILKWCAITLASIAFFVMTRPYDFLLALRWLKIPRGFCFALGIGFRFLPVLFEEGERIVIAQRARGLGSQRGIISIYNLPKLFFSLMIPFLSGIMTRINDMWLALSIRGFKLEEAKIDDLYVFKFKDLIVCIYSVVIIIFSLKL